MIIDCGNLTQALVTNNSIDCVLSPFVWTPMITTIISCIVVCIIVYMIINSYETKLK